MHRCFLSAAACGSTSNSETETGNINSEAEDENSSVSKENSEKTDKKTGEMPAEFTESTFSLVNAGYTHSMAVTEEGVLYTWGDNSKGQLGDGTNEDSSVPVKIMENVTAISAG
ncbi:MAG: hypothetical protein LUD77_02660, partial [Clostridiales bacterium]|nr:hypothetical protein [Clostridiales bacterium]